MKPISLLPIWRDGCSLHGAKCTLCTQHLVGVFLGERGETEELLNRIVGLSPIFMNSTLIQCFLDTGKVLRQGRWWLWKYNFFKKKKTRELPIESYQLFHWKTNNQRREFLKELFNELKVGKKSPDRLLLEVFLRLYC